MIQDRFYIGIDLGGTNIKGGLVSTAGTIIAQSKIKTEADRGPGHVMERMADLILDFRNSNKRGSQICGVGIGVPGQIDCRTGILRNAPNLPGWIDIPVSSELEKRVNLPVVVDNDANIAALGEYAYGAGRGIREMMLVTLGTGVGGGLIFGGQLYRGGVGSAGEFGHMVIQIDGPICSCGKQGCVESFIGTRGLLQRVRDKLASGQQSLLSERDADSITPRDVGDAAAKGDKLAIDVLAETGFYLGIGLGNVANLLNIQRVVVGGGVANAGEFILKSARESLRKTALKLPGETVEVVQAILGEKAGIIGAGRLAMVEL